jgi:hypothetical protein
MATKYGFKRINKDRSKIRDLTVDYLGPCGLGGSNYYLDNLHFFYKFYN